tara:strand:+ start:97 stop:480 length:384 start_codon:yes stop_codon:yes gene_type:complete
MSSKINPKYVPKSLSESDKKKQIKSIKEKTDRPKLKSAKTKRSVHVIKFEKRYNKKITNDAWISKNLLSREGIKQILKKGVAAYYNAGSRPNTTPAQWSRARLASALTGGGAAKVDRAILTKYKVKK